MSCTMASPTQSLKTRRPILASSGDDVARVQRNSGTIVINSHPAIVRHGCLDHAPGVAAGIFEKITQDFRQIGLVHGDVALLVNFVDERNAVSATCASVWQSKNPKAA